MKARRIQQVNKTKKIKIKLYLSKIVIKKKKDTRVSKNV